MKTLKFFFAMAILVICNATAFSQNGNSNGNGNSVQNGNAVISEVHVWDLGQGYGEIFMRVSGNLALLNPTASYVISGDRIPGGTFSGMILGYAKSANVFQGYFPLLPSVGNDNCFINVSVKVAGTNLEEFPTIYKVKSINHTGN